MMDYGKTLALRKGWGYRWRRLQPLIDNCILAQGLSSLLAWSLSCTHPLCPGDMHTTLTVLSWQATPGCHLQMSQQNIKCHRPPKCFALSANAFWKYLLPPNCPCVLLGGIPSQSSAPDVWRDTSECAVWDLCRKIIICLSRKGKLIIRKDPSIITQLGSVSLYILLPGKDVPVSLEPLLEEGTAISDCPSNSHPFIFPWLMVDPLGVGRWSQIIIIRKGRMSHRSL